MTKKNPVTNRYAAIIQKIFFTKYSLGDEEVPFVREDLEKAAKSLKIKLPKNLGTSFMLIATATIFPRKSSRHSQREKNGSLRARGGPNTVSALSPKTG